MSSLELKLEGALEVVLLLVLVLLQECAYPILGIPSYCSFY